MSPSAWWTHYRLKITRCGQPIDTWCDSGNDMPVRVHTAV